MDRPTYPCVHYSELTPYPESHPLHDDWEMYRREVSRLIADGHEGEFVLIKGGEFVALFNSLRDAHREGLKRFGVFTPFLVRQVLTYERIYKAGPIASQAALSPTAGSVQSTVGRPLAKSA